MVVGKVRALHFLGKRVEATALLDRYEPLLDQITGDDLKRRYFLIRGMIYRIWETAPRLAKAMSGHWRWA